MRTEIVKSKVKCPKCRSNSLMLVEVWKGHTISFEQINGEFDRCDGALEPGDAYKVEAHCKECEHHYTIRGALQIDNIIIY